jgi:hypothetical protein
MKAPNVAPARKVGIFASPPKPPLEDPEEEDEKCRRPRPTRVVEFVFPKLLLLLKEDLPPVVEFLKMFLLFGPPPPPPRKKKKKDDKEEDDIFATTTTTTRRRERIGRRCEGFTETRFCLLLLLL